MGLARVADSAARSAPRTVGADLALLPRIPVVRYPKREGTFFTLPAPLPTRCRENLQPLNDPY